MLGIALSRQAQAVADSLTDREFEAFRDIQRYLAEFLPGLIAGDLVTTVTYFGVEGYRYYDQRFPYVIFFRRTLDQSSEREYLLLYLMLRADPHRR